MLYQLKTGRVPGYGEGQEPLIYLVSTAQAIRDADIGFVFSDGHGIAAFTSWFDRLADLNKVDWKAVSLRYWKDTEEDMDRQRRKQAEFLVYRYCPWDLIHEIIVINGNLKTEVERIMAGFSSDLSRKVRIKANWYY
jgi:hypothetical protein